MAAKAFVVFDPSGQPLPGVEVLQSKLVDKDKQISDARQTAAVLAATAKQE